MKVRQSSLITIKGTKTLKNGCKRNIFQFDFSSPEARVLTNYIFCEKNSLPHTAHALSKLKILNLIFIFMRERKSANYEEVFREKSLGNYADFF